jgi:hypothetical protein
MVVTSGTKPDVIVQILAEPPLSISDDYLRFMQQRPCQLLCGATTDALVLDAVHPPQARMHRSI